jgi:hypothetical protein
VGEKEWSKGDSMGRSLEAGQRQGGWTTVAKWQQGGSSVEAALKLREERWRAGMGAMETGRGLGLL